MQIQQNKTEQSAPLVGVGGNGNKIDSLSLLRVIKRNGTAVTYNADKIVAAMTKAFLAVEGPQASDSKRIYKVVRSLTDHITETLRRRWPSGGTVHIEAIQDQVELALMHSDMTHQVDNAQQVAKEFIFYREKRRIEREKKQKTAGIQAVEPSLSVILRDGRSVSFTDLNLDAVIKDACAGLKEVDAKQLLEDTKRNIFDGIPIHELYQALMISTRSLIETNPEYRYVAARVLLYYATDEAADFLGLSHINYRNLDEHYVIYLERFIEKGIALDLLDPRLRSFDLPRLAKVLVKQRNQKFVYLGLRSLYDRYFKESEGVRFELPQAFFMRIAMGLALEEPEEQRHERAIEFYHQLSSFRYMSSTPTLFNAGTKRPQLSSCYISVFSDDLGGIFKGVSDNAKLSKFAGGLGNSLTHLRSMGAHIKGTNGKSLGVVPFIKVINDTAVAVNQGGKRKGAVCVYLEVWHQDIEEFSDLRKNTGDERRRAHDINTAVWIPDLFMKRVLANEDWTLFSPDQTPDLHDLYGIEFEKVYETYELAAKQGNIKSKKIRAVILFRKILSMLYETGHPWITFKDPCNLRSPQQHAGVIHSSNLCTEITLNTSEDEIAVCNLGSINLAEHILDTGEIDLEKLKQTVKTAIRMLDNVIDINYYPVTEARRSNLKHRPIGLGIMGFQDALYKRSLSYDSQAAAQFADQIMETISYYAIEASMHLAKERGCYETYQGSLWSQGILPIDSIEKLAQFRGEQYLKMDRTKTLDWDSLRAQVKQHGMRNSNVMAIAPTATISNICGVTQSIEPTFRNLFVKSNLSGEFTVINTYLVDTLKTLGMWDPVMINDLKYHDGSIQSIPRIPDEIKALYKGAFEIDPNSLIVIAMHLQKWVDQSISRNLYMAAPSGKKISDLYLLAWSLGLKTTYYLRTIGASSAEKSTINHAALNAVKVSSNNETCNLDDPDCEACQ